MTMAETTSSFYKQRINHPSKTSKLKKKNSEPGALVSNPVNDGLLTVSRLESQTKSNTAIHQKSENVPSQVFKKTTKALRVTAVARAKCKATEPLPVVDRVF